MSLLYDITCCLNRRLEIMQFAFDYNTTIILPSHILLQQSVINVHQG